MSIIFYTFLYTIYIPGIFAPLYFSHIYKNSQFNYENFVKMHSVPSTVSQIGKLIEQNTYFVAYVENIKHL